ncbi:MAG: HDOD domain-containing protein [Gammaproteobacteria bacterium]|nr:MAG: HDOD domain-containing protein [Gammaproteobacteria bacterium]
MAVAATLLTYLNRQRVPFQQVHHDRAGSLEAATASAHVPLEKVARAHLLMDERGVVMVVLRASRELDLERLNERLRRRLRPVPLNLCDRLFRDCEPGAYPALSWPYGVQSLVDQSLLEEGEIYLQSGCHTTLLRFDGHTFRQLMSQAQRIAGCCGDASGQEAPCQPKTDATCLERLRKKLFSLYRLPPLPAVATRLLTLTRDPDSTARQVADVVAQDPVLAAQVIRHARSPLYGYRGEIHSVEEAITRVLGFDRVTQLALSLCTMRALNPPLDGPLGLNAIWQHGVGCSELVLRLKRQFRLESVEDPALPLAALLQNFGYFVMAHVCRPEFTMLNKLAAAEPETPVEELERQVLGMGAAREVMSVGHGVLGSLVLEQWKLPRTVCEVALKHHQPQCVEYQPGVLPLVNLASALLKQVGLGEDKAPESIEPACTMLGLDPAEVQDWFDSNQPLSTERLADLVH